MFNNIKNHMTNYGAKFVKLLYVTWFISLWLNLFITYKMDTKITYY
jgi:hypothetical protein